MTSTLSEHQAQEIQALLERVLYELKKVIVGQEHLLERLLMALLIEGHVLVEGAPGLAKTLTLKTLAQVTQLDFKRIQFTPDLLPADITGTRIFNPSHGAFTTELGPIFAHFILADEINRAPAKVQSALLEAMQERQVTIGRETFPLKRPFFVMATQNPIESEGTYPLPEAQLDRFLFKLLITYPDARDEVAIVHRVTDPGPAPELACLLGEDKIIAMQEALPQVYMDPQVTHYIVDLVQATRHPDFTHIQYGASPRGALALTQAAKAIALIQGRNYATPEDVDNVALDCLRHRVLLSYEGLTSGRSVDGILQEVMATVEQPAIGSRSSRVVPSPFEG